MIRIGPAGWSYKDWEGIVYPDPKPRGFQPLAVIARLFDLAEVNVTFYHPPKPDVAEKWCELLDRLGAEPFRFSIKMWQGLTHQGEMKSGQEVEDLRSLCEVLRTRGRLGAVLAQFPWSFKNTAPSRHHLGGLADAWEGFPLAVEMRHASWDDEAYRAWLTERAIAHVNIDQPVIGESLAPSAHVTTSSLAYIRLHGQNREAWFEKDAGRDERYNYLYSSEELVPWAIRVGQVSELADETIVVTNNHFQGQAVANALELQSAALPERQSPVPETLIRRYPELRSTPGLRVAEPGEFDPPPDPPKARKGQLEMF